MIINLWQYKTCDGVFTDHHSKSNICALTKSINKQGKSPYQINTHQTTHILCLIKTINSKLQFSLMQILRDWFQCVPNVNKKSIFYICFEEAFQCRVHIIYRNNFNVRLYIMFSYKINHFLCLLNSSNDPAIIFPPANQIQYL